MDVTPRIRPRAQIGIFGGAVGLLLCVGAGDRIRAVNTVGKAVSFVFRAGAGGSVDEGWEERVCDVATAGDVGWVRPVVVVSGVLIGGMVRGVAVLLMLEVFGVVRGGEGRSLFLKGDRKRLFAPITFGLVPAPPGLGLGFTVYGLGFRV